MYACVEASSPGPCTLAGSHVSSTRGCSETVLVSMALALTHTLRHTNTAYSDIMLRIWITVRGNRALRTWPSLESTFPFSFLSPTQKKQMKTPVYNELLSQADRSPHTRVRQFPDYIILATSYIQQLLAHIPTFSNTCRLSADPGYTFQPTTFRSYTKRLDPPVWHAASARAS